MKVFYKSPNTYLELTLASYKKKRILVRMKSIDCVIENFVEYEDLKKLEKPTTGIVVDGEIYEVLEDYEEITKVVYDCHLGWL